MSQLVAELKGADGQALTQALSESAPAQDPSNPSLPPPLPAPSPLSALGLMRDDGERLVQSGVTSREELVRVTRD